MEHGGGGCDYVYGRTDYIPSLLVYSRCKTAPSNQLKARTVMKVSSSVFEHGET